MKQVLIVGLGNPGFKYRKTRHNTGFILINEIAKRLGVKFRNNKRLNAEVAEVNRDGKELILAKPQTFMNKSGEAVRALMNKYRPSELCLIFDDATMEFGKFRIRHEGSSGGHNGVKSVIEHFGSEKFTRFKFGVGQPPKGIEMDKWVLSKFSSEEMREIEDNKEEIAEEIIRSL